MPPIRTTPQRPLFPYSTLFRSPKDVALLVGLHQAVRRRVFHRRQDDSGSRPALAMKRDEAGEIDLRRHVAVEHQDRKSTRLNSSHRCISYAVFCLIKKINM